MKIARICPACNKPIRESMTYQADLTYYMKNFITGALEEAKIKTRICWRCSQNAGYKTKDYSERFGFK